MVKMVIMRTGIFLKMFRIVKMASRSWMVLMVNIIVTVVRLSGGPVGN